MEIFDLDKEFKNAGNKDELALKIEQLKQEMAKESAESDKVINERVESESALFETSYKSERKSIQEEIASGEYNLYPVQEQQNSNVLEQSTQVMTHEDAMSKLEELRRKSKEISDNSLSTPSSLGLGSIKEKSKSLLGKIGFKK